MHDHTLLGAIQTLFNYDYHTTCSCNHEYSTMYEMTYNDVNCNKFYNAPAMSMHVHESFNATEMCTNSLRLFSSGPMSTWAACAPGREWLQHESGYISSVMKTVFQCAAATAEKTRRSHDPTAAERARRHRLSCNPKLCTCWRARTLELAQDFTH